eukprot:810237-Ditylum_brightwellii.AAC.1
MQASPEVRQQHERFVSARGKGLSHHRAGDKESHGKHQEKTITQQVIEQECKQEPSRKLNTINSHLIFCSKNYYSNAWLEKLLKISANSVALNSKGFGQQQF